MNGQAVALMPVEECKTTAQVAEAIAHSPEGFYVAVEGVAQFVALPIERYEWLRTLQQRLLLREEYIRSLVAQGHTGAELQSLLPQFDQIDEAWLIDSQQARTKLLNNSQVSFQRHLLARGATHQLLDDTIVDDMIDDLLQQVRQESYAA
ncbi:MAG: hypothetical protein ACOYNY_09790 [Caldilineaceae bacterium]